MVRRFCWSAIIKSNYCKAFETLVSFNDCFDLVPRSSALDKNIDFHCIKNSYWLRFPGFMNINFFLVKKKIRRSRNTFKHKFNVGGSKHKYSVKVYLFDIFPYFDINAIINFTSLKCLSSFSNIFVKKTLNSSLPDKYLFS